MCKKYENTKKEFDKGFESYGRERISKRCVYKEQRVLGLYEKTGHS